MGYLEARWQENRSWTVCDNLLKLLEFLKINTDHATGIFIKYDNHR